MAPSSTGIVDLDLDLDPELALALALSLSLSSPGFRAVVRAIDG